MSLHRICCELKSFVFRIGFQFDIERLAKPYTLGKLSAYAFFESQLAVNLCQCFFTKGKEYIFDIIILLIMISLYKINDHGSFNSV